MADDLSPRFQSDEVSSQCETSTGLVTVSDELEDQCVIMTDNWGQCESPQHPNHLDVLPMRSDDVADIGDNDNGEDNVRDTGSEDEKLKYTIVNAIFEAIELSTKTGASLNSIEDLLCYARRMYCRGIEIDEDNHEMKLHWPRDWVQAKTFLNDLC